MSAEPEPDPVKYDEPPYGNATDEQSDKFQADLNAAARDDTGNGYRWRVPCPRCVYEVVVEVEKIRGLDVAHPRAMCLCHHNHQYRPADTAAGCGFDVTVPWSGESR